MITREFARTGHQVGAIGLGCMGMSWGYMESQRDDDASVGVLREALELGVTHIDTADVYGDGHNERLVGRALDPGRRDRVLLATKAGLVVDDLPTRAMHRDGSPAHLRLALEASLRRLNTDHVDLFYLHRVDPEVPLEESWGAMADLVTAGKTRWLGLSEVSRGELDRANAIHPVTAVQSELSLWTRDALGQPTGDDVVAWTAAHDAAFVPYAPLGRGFLTGTVTATANLDANDFRAGNPRFADDALTTNLRIVDTVKDLADHIGATPAQVAIAWTLTRGPHIIPIPGTKRSKYLHENVGAAVLTLGPNDQRLLDELPAPVGSRY